MNITLFEIGQPVTVIINKTGTEDHKKWDVLTCRIGSISKKHIYIDFPLEIANIKAPSILQYLIEKITKSGYSVCCNVTGRVIGRAYFGE